MKKNKLFILITVMLLSVSCNAQSNKKQPSNKVVSNNIEVYYFHYERRCATCLAVEAESKKAVETLYPEQVKSGKISFESLDFTQDASASAIQKAKAEGQSLLIISGNNRIDLTDVAFMYARNNPEKLKAEIKKTIDTLLNLK